MRNFLAFFICLFLLSGIITSGCTDENNYSGQGPKLRFSQDTLSFDTLFSTIGSTTAWLKIVNTDNKEIVLSRVSLKSGGESGFHINLDGENGTVFEDVPIAAGDSLFLFVELTTKVQNSDKPVLIEDAVLFDDGTNQQQIVLQAYSWNATIWHGKTIKSDTTLTANRPYLIYDSLVVAENVTLNIAEGVNLHFHDGAYVKVYGSINAKGSAAAPITFRGDRLDDMLVDFPYDYYPGQWYFIRLTGSSFNNVWDHVNIRGGYYGVMVDSSSVNQVKLKLTNSVINNMVYSCIWSVNSNLSVENSQISNSGGYTVCLIGGNVDFTHCTIVNYQQLVTRDGPALVVTNFLTDSLEREIPYPLISKFTNTIVYGSLSSELGIALSENKNVAGHVFFRNCMLKSAEELSSTYSENCIYPKEPHFVRLGTFEDKYIYDFRIDSISPARNKAILINEEIYLHDMNGISRTTDGVPDIGAYEYNK
jgi:Fe-S cluster assembly iron-binding protein IscA